jgi:phenylalanyl-tRNA synthetase alpha chain
MKNELLQKISSIRQAAASELSKLTCERSAQDFRIRYLSRKGIIPSLLSEMSTLSAEDRPEAGRMINELKIFLIEEIDKKILELGKASQEEAIAKSRLDITLPGRFVSPGRRHPIRQAMDAVVDIFTGLGFSIYEGPEVESDYYNFEALNVPPDHPARDMHDTFYVEGGLLLRTHTSPVQIRVMEREKPPIFMIAPGAVYRRDSDISHSPMFHQVEGLLVDRDINFGHLKEVLAVFCHKMFGEKREVRFRPSFFPFTEPSAEVDISCVICGGKGCRVCKSTGWVEILGCGMVDPEVFKAVRIDPKKYTGFAFGMGIERIAMLIYGINDIRLFYENDIRFLEQF